SGRVVRGRSVYNRARLRVRDRGPRRRSARSERPEGCARAGCPDGPRGPSRRDGEPPRAGGGQRHDRSGPAAGPGRVGVLSAAPGRVADPPAVLVLSRKVDQTIVIEPNITIRILEIN